jgi:hypothetical protein
MLGDPASTSVKRQPLVVRFLFHRYEDVDGAGVNELRQRKVDDQVGAGEKRFAQG